MTFNPPDQPTNEACQPWDTPCVERNVSQQLGYQVQVGEASANQDYAQCLANGTDAGTCRARWPVGYSGNVPILNLTPEQAAGAMMTPAQQEAALAASNAAAMANLQNLALQSGTPLPKPNQSVPPTTPLTTMSTGIQNTGQVLQAQANLSAPPTLDAVTASAAGSSKTLLIVAAVGVGLFLLMGAKR